MDVTARSLSNMQVEILAGTHRLIADEPPAFGEDAGPNPYSLLLASLGACTVMALHLYARRKNWPLEEVEISLHTYHSYTRDSQGFEQNEDARLTIINSELSFKGNLTEEQMQTLAAIAKLCPVHRTLTDHTIIQSQIVP